MTHPSPEELADLASGEAHDPAASEHVGRCAACQEELRGLAALLADLRRAGTSDLTPLFWQHFPQRVSRALDADIERRDRRRALGWRWAWASGATLALVAVLGAWAWRAAGPSGPVRPASIADVALPAPLGPVEDSVETVVWERLASAADGLDWDTLSGAALVLRPGVADRAIGDLSDEERRELVRLLRSEIGQQSGEGPSS